jgi:histidyl-tRNA synthetase
MRFQALPGFRDFFPEDLAIRRTIEAAWHGAARAAGFEEFDGPVLESLELFTAKSGEEISAQMYTFTDKGDRAVALRPEMTPTLARMIASRANRLARPIKWYCVPEFYRYEKPQRGRLRAFYQWNVDVLGSDEPAADAEAIAVALDALRRLGLTERDVGVRINDRRFIARTLRIDVARSQDGGCSPSSTARGAIAARADALEALLGTAREGAARASASFRWRAPELRPCSMPARLASASRSCPTSRSCAASRTTRASSGRSSTAARSSAPSRAEAGTTCSSSASAARRCPRSASAWASGARRAAGAKGSRRRPRVEVVVVPVVAELLGAARMLVARLRANGTAAEAPYGVPRVGRALKAADAAGAKRVVIVGPDEWASGEVVVKDLASGTETRVRADDLT